MSSEPQNPPEVADPFASTASQPVLPQHEVQGLKNMWLVGGGTHPGSGLPVIFLSAQITAAKLAERAGLPARSSVPQPLFAGELALKLRTPALERAAAVSIGGTG